MIKVDKLVKSYGSFKVLDEISFEVKQGSVYGFLGHNGVGKSTTMNILTGLIGYDSGKVTINNTKVDKNSKDIIKNIGYLPESPKFYSYMNAYEYLKFIGEISGYSKSAISKRTEELLEYVKLKDAAKRRIGGYSRGMKQRLGLAVAVYNNPKVLFLDEPSSALDPEGRKEIIEIIERFKDQNTTVFLSTHILNDVERVCDEIAILNNGKIVLQGQLDKVMEDFILPVYDIEFENSCEDIKGTLLKKDWIQKIQVNRKNMSIYVDDRDKAKKELLKVMSNIENPVTSYKMRKSNLEDIFIRTVNSNEKS